MERATFSQVPPTSKFFPQPQATFSQAPPTSSGVPLSLGTSYQVPSHQNANTRQQDAWYQTPPQPNLSPRPQETSYFMPPPTNSNPGPQGTSYQTPRYPEEVPSGAEHHSTLPPGIGSANPGTLGNKPPRGNSSTSPTRSSDSDMSDKSDKSKKSRRSHGDDRLGEILGTLTLQNIGMSDSKIFSGDVSKFHRFLNCYEGLMKNVADPQVKLN
jgi:hypothetical protein